MTVKENIVKFLDKHVASTYDELSQFCPNREEFDKILEEMKDEKLLTESPCMRSEWCTVESQKYRYRIFQRVKR